jgi:hypothetical protein
MLKFTLKRSIPKIGEVTFQFNELDKTKPLASIGDIPNHTVVVMDGAGVKSTREFRVEVILEEGITGSDIDSLQLARFVEHKYRGYLQSKGIYPVPYSGVVKNLSELFHQARIAHQLEPLVFSRKNMVYGTKPKLDLILPYHGLLHICRDEEFPYRKKYPHHRILLKGTAEFFGEPCAYTFRQYVQRNFEWADLVHVTLELNLLLLKAFPYLEGRVSLLSHGHAEPVYVLPASRP